METTNKRYTLVYIPVFDSWYIKDNNDVDPLALLTSMCSVTIYIPNAKGFKSPEGAIKFLQQKVDPYVALKQSRVLA
ncbi:MAG: hypothetical protein ACOZAO_04100 [Patescibacteria group bacterium]